MNARAAFLGGLLLALLWPASLAAENLDCRWSDVDVVARSGTPVAAAVLRRPYMEARFGAGTFYALEACGTHVGLLFDGEGELDVRDPGPQRGPQLHNRSEDLPGTVLFDKAALWASDGAVAALLAQVGGLGDGAVPPAARALLVSRSSGFMSTNRRDRRPPSEVLWAPTPEQGGILAEFRTAGVGWTRRATLDVLSPWLTYVWSPTGPLGDPHEPGLWSRRGTGTTLEVLFSAFPSEEDIAVAGTPFGMSQRRLPWDLEDVTVALAVSGPVGLKRVLEDVEGDAQLRLRATEDAGRWVMLTLARGKFRDHGDEFGRFVVDGVTAALDGEPEPVPWARVSARLWVQLPRDPLPGEVVRLRVRWHGRVLEIQGETGITPLAGEAWYPRPPGGDRHRLTTSVAVPSFWEVIATGHRIGEEDDGKVKVVTSRSNHPVQGGTVVIADVRTEVIPPTSPGVPLVRLHRSPQYPAINSRVATELAEHLAALVDILGPYPWSELEIVERGADTGFVLHQPGLVGVPVWDSPPSQIVTTGGRFGVLNALVRQWLVHDLGPNTHHDRWLIEGLVTWAECLVLDTAEQGGKCHGDLRGLRESWMDRTGSSGGVIGDAETQDMLAGAIWLGPLSGAPYGNQFLRGPLVLHSLRLLVGDAVVRQVLPRLMIAYGGQGLALRSFLVQLQATAGMDLREFIYGWVFNTPTQPVASLDYRLIDEGGSWTLIGTGLVDDGRATEPPLPLPTPLLLSFKVNGETYLRRIVLREAPSEVRIEGSPDKPKDVRLDPGGTFPGKITLKRVKE